MEDIMYNTTPFIQKESDRFDHNVKHDSTGCGVALPLCSTLVSSRGAVWRPQSRGLHCPPVATSVFIPQPRLQILSCLSLYRGTQQCRRQHIPSDQDLNTIIWTISRNYFSRA